MNAQIREKLYTFHLKGEIQNMFSGFQTEVGKNE